MSETITIAIESNAQEILGKFERLPPAVQKGILDHLRGALLVAEDAVRLGTGVKWRRGARGLAGRLTSYSRKGAGAIAVDAAIGFRKTRQFPYELAQEFGAKAAPGKAMAIPVSPEAKGASDRGIGPRQAFGNMLHIVKFGNKAMLVRTLGFAKSQVEYVLVKSIKPRLKFRETVSAQSAQISRAIVAGFEAGWKEVSFA